MTVQSILEAMKSESHGKSTCDGCETCRAHDELQQSEVAAGICVYLLERVAERGECPSVVLMEAMAIGVEIGVRKAAAEQLKELEARS